MTGLATGSSGPKAMKPLDSALGHLTNAVTRLGAAHSRVSFRVAAVVGDDPALPVDTTVDGDMAAVSSVNRAAEIIDQITDGILALEERL